MGVLNVAWPPAQAVEDQAVRKFTSGRRPRLGTPSKESPCLNSEMTGKEASLGSMASPEIIDGVPVESNETPATELWDAPSWARGAASPRGSLIAARVSLFEQAIDVDKHQRNISKHAEDPEFLLALKAASQAAQLLRSGNPSDIDSLPDRIKAESLPDLEPLPGPSAGSPASSETGGSSLASPTTSATEEALSRADTLPRDGQTEVQPAPSAPAAATPAGASKPAGVPAGVEAGPPSLSTDAASATTPSATTPSAPPKRLIGMAPPPPRTPRSGASHQSLTSPRTADGATNPPSAAAAPAPSSSSSAAPVPPLDIDGTVAAAASQAQETAGEAGEAGEAGQASQPAMEPTQSGGRRTVSDIMHGGLFKPASAWVDGSVHGSAITGSSSSSSTPLRQRGGHRADMPGWARAREREEEAERQRELDREERWQRWREEQMRIDRESRAEASSSARSWLDAAVVEAENEDSWALTPERPRGSGYVPLGERSRGPMHRLPRISRAGFGSSGARSILNGEPSELPRVRRAGPRASWSRRNKWSFSRNPSWARSGGFDETGGDDSPKMVIDGLPPPPPPPRRKHAHFAPGVANGAMSTGVSGSTPVDGAAAADGQGVEEVAPPRTPGAMIAAATASFLTPPAAAPPSSQVDMELFTEGAVKRNQKMFDDMMMPLPGLPPPPPPRKKRMETQVWL